MNLPQDPMMLYSVINTKLRDQYDSLEELCEDLNVSQENIEKKLREVGFVYSRQYNKFM